MRFTSWSAGGSTRFGGVVGDAVTDLTDRFGSLLKTLQDDRLDEAVGAVASGSPCAELAELELLPPVPDAEKYPCIGVNYANRNAEYRDGSAAPRYPSVFMRVRDSFTGHMRQILRPPESRQLDYEGEIAIIIGKEGRRISEQDAPDYIAGYSLMNEGSVRDWIRHGKFNVTPGKNFASSGSIGPWMVTADEIANMDDLRLQTTVNGELRQDDNTANLMFPFRYIIAYLSSFMRLRPGDTIATGTPEGAGARFDPPRYLVPGDRVAVSCPQIGTLTNIIADEIVK